MSGRRIGALETEGRAAALADLDTRPTADVVRAVVDGHDGVQAAVRAAEPAIAALVDAAAERHAAGGRIVYTGAGSAGWIAFVDAMELGPTYSDDRGRRRSWRAPSIPPARTPRPPPRTTRRPGAAAVRALAPARAATS